MILCKGARLSMSHALMKGAESAQTQAMCSLCGQRYGIPHIHGSMGRVARCTCEFKLCAVMPGAPQAGPQAGAPRARAIAQAQSIRRRGCPFGRRRRRSTPSPPELKHASPRFVLLPTRFGARSCPELLTCSAQTARPDRPPALQTRQQPLRLCQGAVQGAGSGRWASQIKCPLRQPAESA